MISFSLSHFAAAHAVDPDAEAGGASAPQTKSRSFVVGEVSVQSPPSGSRKVTATFEVRYALKDAEGTTGTGHSKVELDMVKPDKAIKIVRFNGTSFPDTRSSLGGTGAVRPLAVAMAWNAVFFCSGGL